LGSFLLGALPLAAVAGLLALLPAVMAWRQLTRFAATPELRAPAIRLTLLAAHTFPLLLGATLIWIGEPA
jgi:hypothetical protein